MNSSSDAGQRGDAGPPNEFGSNAPCPTVAIGSSAGGVQALQEFFDEVPPDLGVAFVVIAHLNPTVPSELAAILGRVTSMKVAQVVDQTVLEPNHVYIIPPDRTLAVMGNAIRVAPFGEPRGQRAPIDYFFRSLAEGHGDGFAIILSGSGADGAVGIKAVKEGGGLILVQDPSEADFASMPRCAIATGLADIVAPVRELAKHLAELAREKQRLRRAGIPNVEAALNGILSYLRTRTGHDFSRYKRSTVMRRLARRMQLRRMSDYTEYLRYLRENVEEVSALFSDLLISVTTFFRDHDSFHALATLVLPTLVTEAENDPIRVWVPGCATGEEAYSIAILLLEEAARRDVRPEIQIFASDLDPGVLATAREGRYPAAIEADVNEERLQRFFTRDGDHYRIKKEVRDLVVFANHSLLKDPPFSRLDLISCRNLLIYLERELQNQVCASFAYALKPGRYLFLGSAETVDAVPGQFRALDRENRLYQSLEHRRTGAPLPQVIPGPPTPIMPQTRAQQRSTPQADAAIHLAALEALAPPSILVDQDHRVVHLSESAGRYLQPSGGPLNTTIVQLARPELRLDIRTGLHKAFERGESSLSLPISVQFNGSPHRTLVHVRPIVPKRDDRLCALILFIDGGAIEQGAMLAEEAPSSGTDDAVRHLQEELHLTRERLKASREEFEASNEELRAANEELQSINEEYRSTAEELETSKEELQSMNEELQTLNTELKAKLEGVSRAHSDLQNIMAATEVGTLFLDPLLRIKRFTPRVADLFSITPSDEGRPITDFTHKLKYDRLVEDARQVLRDLTPQTREAQAISGRWYQIRLRPYRTVDDKIDGIVSTFVDITERLQSEEHLRHLTAELDHRVKNILARVAVVVERSRKPEQTSDELAETLKRRLRSMAETHALLSRTRWVGASINQLCNAELVLYAQGDNVVVTGDDIVLAPEPAQSFSMVLHELTTNAVKHGALSRPGGRVEANVEVSATPDHDGTLRLTWIESGGPPPSATPKRSYGMQVIEGLLAYELAGTVHVDFRPEGFRYEVSVPLSRVHPNYAPETDNRVI